MIPGLEEVEIFRFGAIHRNTYINSPSLLNNELELKTRPGNYFAGQITGVEGYLESASMGLLASLSATAKILKKGYNPPPRNTALGALINYLTASSKKNFQPMNINFGLFSMSKSAKHTIISRTFACINVYNTKDVRSRTLCTKLLK